MDGNNDFDKVWKQIVYKTLDDNNDEQIMSYLRVCNDKKATTVNTEGLEESLIAIVKMDIYD